MMVSLDIYLSNMDYFSETGEETRWNITQDEVWGK